MILQKKKKFMISGDHKYKETVIISFRTVVSEVSSFMGNPVNPFFS